MVKKKTRYRAAGKQHGVPWHLVAVIHMLEGSGSFSTHLHNGDPLTARTVHDPKRTAEGRHAKFTWQESASDALVSDGLSRWTNWSLPGTPLRLGTLQRVRLPEERDQHPLATPVELLEPLHEREVHQGQSLLANGRLEAMRRRRAPQADGLTQAREDRRPSPDERSAAVSNLRDRVPIPPKDTINTNLSSATERIMLRKFGKPGALTKNCSAPSGRFRRRIKSGVDVGPFKVSGLDFAVESLRQIFAEVEVKRPLVFREVKTGTCVGNLCARCLWPSSTIQSPRRRKVVRPSTPRRTGMLPRRQPHAEAESSSPVRA